MSGVTKRAASSLTAAMRYRDVEAAVEWLRSRVGFELHSSVRDDDGAMVYAQVAFGNAMVMLAPIQDTPLDRYMRQPDEIGGAETQSCYFHVADAAAHFARAKAAGAEIILPLEPYDSGGQGYSCRDPEGHIWTFGDFDPWGRDGGEASRAVASGQARPQRRLATVLGVLAVLGASGAAAAWYSGADIAGLVGGQIHVRQERPAATVAVVRETNTEEVKALQARLAAETTTRTAAEQAAKSTAAELERERKAVEGARREIGELQARVTAEVVAQAEIEAKVAGFAADAERERSAREEAERKAQTEAAAAASHQSARMMAETAAREAQAEAEKARNAKVSPATALDGTQAQERQRLAAQREAAEAGLKQAREELQRERSAREAAERKAQAEAVSAASHQAARSLAETEVREARAEADKLRSVRTDAAPKDIALEKRLTAEREAAEAGLKQAREELQRERSAREAAEKASQEAARRVEAAETAGAAAAASVTTLRAELAAEQAAKRSAWNAINALRKQAAQVQRTKAVAAASDADGGAEPGPVAQPKRKQVLQKQQPLRKRRPASAED